jgi:hypothetical protein
MESHLTLSGGYALVICKPAIRRTAEEGDWIAGTGSKDTPMGDMSNKLVYAMRVTSKMTMESYDAFIKAEGPEKIPDNRSKDWRRWLGDSIYDYSRNPPLQRPGAHGKEDRVRDLSGEFALLSEDFIYFGDQAIPIPDDLLAIVKEGQAHRSSSNDPYLPRFIEWIRTLQQSHGSAVLAKPQYFPGRPPGDHSQCSVGTREEDVKDAATERAVTDWTFAYGSNMKTGDLEADLHDRYGVSNSIIETAPAVLPGWRLVWNYPSVSRGCGAANIEEAAGQDLPGVAIRLTDAGLKALDKKEGHRKDPEQSSYRRYLQSIGLSSGQTIEAWTYVARPEKTRMDPQWPSKAYRQLLIDGATENRLPKAHIEALKDIQVCD